MLEVNLSGPLSDGGVHREYAILYQWNPMLICLILSQCSQLYMVEHGTTEDYALWGIQLVSINVSHLVDGWYNMKHILFEAVESFLWQDRPLGTPAEVSTVIVNESMDAIEGKPMQWGHSKHLS